ncbi:MAG: hypothetical protein JO281_16910 [Pseudonocardiales bacterium]|nr:hypothetical protein [Pseudonocardiales bacterium]
MTIPWNVGESPVAPRPALGFGELLRGPVSPGQVNGGDLDRVNGTESLAAGLVKHTVEVLLPLLIRDGGDERRDFR